MATITEDRVDISIRLTIDKSVPPVVQAIVTAHSYTADGATVRSLQRDVADQLSAARLTAIADLLSDVETRIKTLWDIP